MLHAAMRLLVATLLAARSAEQSPSGEGHTCAGHADCAAGLYCTQGEECGLCRDDEEEPCAMWGDSIDGSCAVCGDGPDLAASASGSSATVDEADQDVADADDGDGQQKKSGRRKGGRRRKQGAGSGADARNAGAEAPFVTVPGAFTPQELDRVRREVALIPAVHSNAGITGKRNVGTKESEIRGLSRERFSWVYEKMRKLVHETNAAQWRFEQLGEVSDALQIATYHAASGGKYEWHVDQNLWGASTHAPRIMSVTVQLTPVPEDREAAGGRLFLGGDVPELAAGTAVVFPSYMPHRVEQVNTGSREAMIAFFEGSDSRFESLAMRALTSSVLALPEQQKLRTLLGEAQVETGLLAEGVETLTLAAAHDEQQVRVQQQQQHETGEGNRTRDFHTLDMLGVALYLSGRLTDAEVAFGEARAAAPELATGHAKLGSTLMRQGRQAEAANCYGQAIASAQQAGEAPDSRFLYNKGTLHMQLGQSEEATAMFEAAITADPAHVKAMGNLAAVRIGAARHAEAVALLERALSVSEMEQGKLVADLAVALGGAHEAAGGGAGAVGSKDSLEAAHRAYSRALRAHPSHAGAAAQVAALELRMKRGEKNEL